MDCDGAGMSGSGTTSGDIILDEDEGKVVDRYRMDDG